MSQLKDGRIPANTVCPFKDSCGIAQSNLCNHRGTDHRVAFSCATARGFDMLAKYSKKKEK